MNRNSLMEDRFRRDAESRGYQLFWKGWPDYAIVKDERVIFVEVKRDGKLARNRGFALDDKRRLSLEQEHMAVLLESLGAEYHVYSGDWHWEKGPDLGLSDEDIKRFASLGIEVVDD